MKKSGNSFINKLFETFASTSRSRYIFLFNLENNCARLSPNAVDFFGMPSEYIYDYIKVWGSYLSEDDQETFKTEMDKIISGEKKELTLEYRVRGKDGNYVVCRSRGLVVEDEEKGIRYFAGTIANCGVIDNIDPVTNLYNMYEFIREMQLLTERKESIKVLLIGFKHFSDINDIYGYAFGNIVMKKIAKILLEKMHGRGNVFRMDGAKFALSLKNMNMEEIKAFYLEIKECVQNQIEVEGDILHLFLCGSMMYLEHTNMEGHKIYSAARYALAKSKTQKIGELVVVDDDTMSDNLRAIELISVMKKNIQEGCEGFYMCYQPIISSKTGKLVAIEALLRWNSSIYGEISPGVFVPWIEHDGGFFTLGNWILKKSLEDTKNILEDYPDFLLHVNISYTQLERSEFRFKLLEILEITGFPAKNLCLELTERCRFLDVDFLKNEVNFFKSKGIKIAIDDFGTGFSSLNLLKEFPIDYIKIDRGFVKEIEENFVDQSIVGAVVKCAKDLDIDVCVEGVESEQIVNYIERYDASSYQGYYYSKPIRIEKLKEFILARKK